MRDRRLAVLVHSWAEAERALSVAAEQACEVELVMSAGILGSGCIAAIEEGLDRIITALVDDRAGLALACLRAGLRRIVFEGPFPQRGPLVHMAARMGAVILAAPPAPLHCLASTRHGFIILKAPATLGPAAAFVP